MWSARRSSLRWGESSTRCWGASPAEPDGRGRGGRGRGGRAALGRCGPLVLGRLLLAPARPLALARPPAARARSPARLLLALACAPGCCSRALARLVV